MSESQTRFEQALTRQQNCRRDEAVDAIRLALAGDAKQPTADQLEDLADAVDALRAGQFYVAVQLAKGSLRPKPHAKKRIGRAPTLDEMKSDFLALQAARR